MPDTEALVEQPLAGPVAAGPDSEAVPKGLRAAYMAAVQAGASDDYLVTRSEGSVRAFNPAQALISEFTPNGVRIALEDGHGDWSLSLKLSAYGCAGELIPLGSAEPQSAHNRVEYRREPTTDTQLVEWYVNGPLGLEQGFTLASAPPCDCVDEREVVIELSLAGELSAALSEDGETVALRNASGAAVLYYSDLFVHDAEERLLPARIEVEEQTLSIHIDAAGATYPLWVDPLIAQEQTKLVPSDGNIRISFGRSVAISGNTAVVGAPFGVNDSGISTGAAYVFVRRGASWSQQAKLLAEDGLSSDLFGNAVAVSGDTAVVGARFGDNDSGISTGAAYVFVRRGVSWSQQAKLLAPDGRNGDSFGRSVAVSEDTAVVGAFEDDNSGFFGSGSAYVFARSGTSWAQQAKLVAGDQKADAFFGNSVAVSGKTVVVGAFLDDIGFHVDAGAAYVFERTHTRWLQQAKLVASDRASSDFFGFSVAVSGKRIVVGATGDDNVQNGIDSGAAYVFERNHIEWSQQAKLLADDGLSLDNFGSSAAMSGDTIVVGANRNDNENGRDAGAAYVFARSGPEWLQQAKVLAEDGEPFDNFGDSAAMSEDTVVVGAPGNFGSAYVFDLKNVP